MYEFHTLNYSKLCIDVGTLLVVLVTLLLLVLGLPKEDREREVRGTRRKWVGVKGPLVSRRKILISNKPKRS